MWKAIQTETKKAFQSGGFRISIGIGMLVCIMQTIWFYVNIYSVSRETLEYISDLTMKDPGYGEWYATRLLEGWLGCESYSSYKAFFLLALPLLAVLPYGISLFLEWRSGYAMQMLVRCGRKNYIGGKSVATFLSGGVVVAVPLIMSLLFCACYLPAVGIDMLSMQGQLIDRNMWSELYYELPVVYALLYILVIFIYGGIFALLPLLCTGWFDNRFGILIFPMMVYCMLNYGISNLFPQFSPYNPAVFLDPGQPVSSNTTLGVVITTAVLLGMEVILLFISNRRRDFL